MTGKKSSKIKVAVVLIGDNSDRLISPLTRCFRSLESTVSPCFESVAKLDRNAVQTKLVVLCNEDDAEAKSDVVLTFGGIGCRAEDVVPEATADLIQRPLPALSHLFHERCDLVSLRPVFGMREAILIGNLPGLADVSSTRAADENDDDDADSIVDLAKYFLEKFAIIHSAGMEGPKRANDSSSDCAKPSRNGKRSLTPKTTPDPGCSEAKKSKKGGMEVAAALPIPFKSEPASDDDDNTVIFDNDGEDHDGDDDDDDDVANNDLSDMVVNNNNDNNNRNNNEDDQRDSNYTLTRGKLLDADDDNLHYGLGNEDNGVTAEVKLKVDPSDLKHVVGVGKPLFHFLKTHPLTKGVVLNRNKRHLKRDLVSVKEKAGGDVAASFTVTAEKWTRNGKPMNKNWLDDEFELTFRGRETRQKLDGGGGGGSVKDTSVCTWYLSCPGTLTCLRGCGGIGVCRVDCRGKTSKLDRHNCQLMVKMQIFLSDVTAWVVSFYGRHNETNALPAGCSASDRRLFGDEQKRVLNSLISGENIVCREELFRRLRHHYRQNDFEISSHQTQKLYCFIDRYLAKHLRSVAVT